MLYSALAIINAVKARIPEETTQAMTSYATQMQMVQRAEQIQFMQLAIEEVRQGQEYNRLAMALLSRK